MEVLKYLNLFLQSKISANISFCNKKDKASLRFEIKLPKHPTFKPPIIKGDSSFAKFI